MLSPERYSRTRSTLPELIAHPSQFAPRISSGPFAFCAQQTTTESTAISYGTAQAGAQTLAASGLRDFRVPFVPDTLSAPNDDPP